MIIIGGGMAGMTLACAAASSLRVALIDATPEKKEDHRLIALNYSSYCLFENLGVWKKMAAHATAIETVHVSQRGKFGVTRLQHTELNLPVLGYVIPARFIEAALQQSLGNVTIMRPAALQALSQDENSVTAVIKTDDGEKSLTAKLLVGADGTHSTVRKLADMSLEVTDYQQTAIVTETELQRSHQHIAYERFHADGAVAMLPLSGNRAATIWTDKNSEIEKLIKLSDEEFLQALQKKFGYRLGRFLRTGTRFTYPLLMQTVRQTRNGNIILVGNAAHTLHPVAAQGLNLALAEIAMLMQTISATPAQPEWQAYELWQQKKLAGSIQLSHHLLRLFSVDFAPVTWARQAGMLGLELIPSLKRRFAVKALGRGDELPALLTKFDR
jgi:2-octaprenyl-6-methoxyphenol hydroxylase